MATTAAAAHAQGGSPAPPAQAQPPAPPPPPPPRLVVEGPQRGTIVREGQDGRYLLGGTWYFRQDDDNVGLAGRYFAQRSLVYWSPIRVPHNWNARDVELNRSSVGWYRKELRLPRALCERPPERPRRGERKRKRRRPTRCDRFRWRVRFMGANHHATAWLNGRKLGTHAGGYLPFELPLELRPGRNTLVVRVSTLRGGADLTHWRAARFNGYGTGGWWNFGGLLREVYLRRIDGIDIQSLKVLPRLRCVRCAARVGVEMRVRYLGDKKRKVALSALLRDGKRLRSIDFPGRFFSPGEVRDIREHFTIRRPRLWQPGRPSLYGLVVAARAGQARSVYRASFGVRKIEKLRDGRVLLNGRRMRVRGASFHEDHVRAGAAWGRAQWRETLGALRRLGATVTRAHYPVHPALLEAFDRAGILVWSQAPVYQLPNALLDLPSVRRRAVNANRKMVEANWNHPSIFAWSMANELGSGDTELGLVGPGYSAFITETARMIRRMDDTRLVAIDRHSRLGEAPYYPALLQLDALGVNEYFGWYKASAPGLADSTTGDLLPYLDGVHSQLPRLAMFITEYGAESTTNGPSTERGTYDFQTQWSTDHVILHGARPYINGSLVWALKDFRVHPDWVGGNDAKYATPPWNNKGLIHEQGAPKPAFNTMRRIFRRTRQLR